MWKNTLLQTKCQRGPPQLKSKFLLSLMVYWATVDKASQFLFKGDYLYIMIIAAE